HSGFLTANSNFQAAAGQIYDRLRNHSGAQRSRKGKQANAKMRPKLNNDGGQLMIRRSVWRPVPLLLISLMVCVLGRHRLSVSSPPQQPPTTTLAGLHERVTVRRDERGIPYIEAANDEDLYFAQGYVIATDRLWQMDFLRRTVRGELAEIFGQPALPQ